MDPYTCSPVGANLHHQDIDPPEVLLTRQPLSAAAARTVAQGRQALREILERRDGRLFVVVGPCSIHDTEAGLDYALGLRALQARVGDVMLLVMRSYFEKPRTSTGWKGFVNDPDLDGSCRMASGIERARAFLRAVAELGVPTATEALDPLLPCYLGDLIAWTAIGARTTESQTHRALASGLATPVGFKNGTDGGLAVAVNAILSAASSHAGLGLDARGRIAVQQTYGNPNGHLVLRGGGGRPNYDTVSVRLAEQALHRAGLPMNIVVDCAHDNSGKDPTLQAQVLADVVSQLCRGSRSLVGLMVESNLLPGKQLIPTDPRLLQRGLSITDACVGWAETERMLLEAASALRSSSALAAAQRRAAVFSAEGVPALA